MKVFIHLFIIMSLCHFVTVSLSRPAFAVTLGDYWQGKARWQVYHKLTVSNGWSNGGAGVQIVPHNNKWYIIYRAYTNDPTCHNSIRGWTEIRESSDQGHTWSTPIKLIDNTPNTRWACYATDGSIYFDSSQGRWYYLFQCLGKESGIWNGCLVRSPGNSPYATFSADNITNPAIKNGTIWSQICKQPNSRCPDGGLSEEGTFDIFQKVNDTYWISFHGWDGTNGYRGTASTKDFVNYTPGSKAYLTPSDSQSWRESWQNGSTGFGAGNITLDNGYYYSFNEASDLNLQCVNNQNWDWGIYRSSDLINWQPYPLGNPIFYSSKWQFAPNLSLPCRPAYGRIFRDGSDIYLHISRPHVSPTVPWTGVEEIHIYRLVDNTDLLQNNTFWKCNLDSWQSMATSTVNLERYTEQTTDGTCSVNISQGDLYQDVSSLPTNRSYNMSIILKSAAASSLNLVAHEFNSQNSLVKSTLLATSPTTTYQTFNKPLTLSSETTSLRIQAYLKTGTVNIDTISLTPADNVPIPPTPGDLTGDGHVNLSDFNLLISKFGNPYTLVDFNLLIANWGK